jgi:hypothetical protein
LLRGWSRWPGTCLSSLSDLIFCSGLFPGMHHVGPKANISGSRHDRGRGIDTQGWLAKAWADMPRPASSASNRPISRSRVRSVQAPDGSRRAARSSYRHCEHSEAIHGAAPAVWIASSQVLLAMTKKTLKIPRKTIPLSVVILRESGGSSTPRLLGSVASASECWDRPVKPGDDSCVCAATSP